MIESVNKLFKYSYFLQELVARDFKSKYYKSFLGVLWTILNPLLMMVVITIVFSTLFQKSIEYYPVYYLSGWLVFNFNSDATNQGLHSIVANAGLIKKIYLPSYLFCVSKVILAFITKLITMLPMFVMMAVLGAPFHWTLLLLPLPMLLTFLFSLGLALALASMAVYFRDLFHLYNIVTLAWMYLTPIFYPISIIPPNFQFIWNYNPMFHYTTMMRQLVLNGTLPSTTTLLYAASYSMLSIGLGVILYRKLQANFLLHM